MVIRQLEVATVPCRWSTDLPAQSQWTAVPQLQGDRNVRSLQILATLSIRCRYKMFFRILTDLLCVSLCSGSMWLHPPRCSAMQAMMIRWVLAGSLFVNSARPSCKAVDCQRPYSNIDRWYLGWNVTAIWIIDESSICIEHHGQIIDRSWSIPNFLFCSGHVFIGFCYVAVLEGYWCIRPLSTIPGRGTSKPESFVPDLVVWQSPFDNKTWQHQIGKGCHSFI